MPKLKLTIGDVVINADLLDTPTADALYAAAPFSASANTWGEEVYFDTPCNCPQEADARTVVELGELAYWMGGDAIAICYGRTPVSQGDESRLISPGNVFATTQDDVKQLSRVRGGASITVEKSDA